jgi:dihydrofolate reductase
VLPDAASAGRLRERFDRVAVIGSGALVRSLLAEDVLDRLQLGLYPVGFGLGKRLFDADTVPSSFRLVEPARSFEKGAVSLIYERAGDVQTMDMPDEPQA